MSDSPIQLQVGALSYGGWERVSIHMGLEQLCGMFQLSVSDKWAGQPIARPVRAGSKAAILLNGAPVITGHIDEVKIERDGQDHSISFSGRDATGDLMDCIVEKPLQCLGLTLDTVARKLCQPFGIDVKVQGKVGDKWPIQTPIVGERVFEALMHLAQERGILLTTDGLGHLVLANPGTTKAPGKIVMGQNVLKSSGCLNLRDRFSKYIVWGQLPGGQQVPNMDVEGVATDATMTKLRYRPTGAECDVYAAPKYCLQRAQWMRTVAAARSEEITYTVPGWMVKGALWRHNTLVPVTDADFDLNDTECLISRVVYKLDEDGMTCDLTVTGKHAYDGLAVPDDVLLQLNAGGG